MISLQQFQDYLSNPTPLQPVTISYIGENASQISQWTVSLSMLSETTQCERLEQVLSEVMISDMNDDARLTLMDKLYITVERVISALHAHYLYETALLSDEQKQWSEHAKSLYYLCILIYSGILYRHLQINSQIDKTNWKSLIPFSKSQKAIITNTIQKIIGLYFKILIEEAIAYQKAPLTLWQQLNHLYLIAMQEEILTTPTHAHILHNHAENIQQHYYEVCLYSLLNLFSYRRQDILNLYKMTPAWAKFLQVTYLPEPESKAFVNLHGYHAPEHITPYSSVNPYDDGLLCLFINLQPLINHLRELSTEHINESNNDDLLQKRLAKMAIITLQHSLLQDRKPELTEGHPGKPAKLVSGFYKVHYYLAGKSSLGNLIYQNELPVQYHPQHHILGKISDANSIFSVEILDETKNEYRFQFDKFPDPINNEAMPALPITMQVLSIFAIRVEPNKNDSQRANSWQIGAVRWIENNDRHLESGGYILSRAATACGVRLATHDGRSQNFVPALLIAADPEQGLASSIMMPRYHFKVGDKIILRIANKQTQLRLERKMFNSDDVEQYEIVQLVSK